MMGKKSLNSTLHKSNHKNCETRGASPTERLQDGNEKKFTDHEEAQRLLERATIAHVTGDTVRLHDRTDIGLFHQVENEDGTLLTVECGMNKATLDLSKLCQGSKGPCIEYQGSRLTPNEFQFISGRETAKDWKRSIRHNGKSLKLLVAQNLIEIHRKTCDCRECQDTKKDNRLTSKQQKLLDSSDVTHYERMRGIVDTAFVKGDKPHADVDVDVIGDVLINSKRVAGKKIDEGINESDKYDDVIRIVVEGDEETTCSENSNNNVIERTNVYEKVRRVNGIKEHTCDPTTRGDESGDELEDRKDMISIVPRLVSNRAEHQVEEDTNSDDSDDDDEDTIKYDYDAVMNVDLKEKRTAQIDDSSSSAIREMSHGKSIANDKNTDGATQHKNGHMFSSDLHSDTDDECDAYIEEPLDLSLSSSLRSTCTGITNTSRLKSKILREKSNRCRIIDQHMTTCIDRHLQTAFNTRSENGNMMESPYAGVVMDETCSTMALDEDCTHIGVLDADLTMGFLDPDSCSYDSGIDDTNVSDSNTGGVNLTPSLDTHVRGLKQGETNRHSVILDKAEPEYNSSHEIGEQSCCSADSSRGYKSVFTKYDLERSVSSMSESLAVCNRKTDRAMFEQRHAIHAQRAKQYSKEGCQPHQHKCHLSCQDIAYHHDREKHLVVKHPISQRTQQRKHQQRLKQRDRVDQHRISNLQHIKQTGNPTRAAFKPQKKDYLLGEHTRYDARAVQQSTRVGLPFQDGFSRRMSVPQQIQEKLSLHAGLAQSSDYIRMLTAAKSLQLSSLSSVANLTAADDISSYKLTTGLDESVYKYNSNSPSPSHLPTKGIRPHCPAIKLELPELSSLPFIRRSMLPSWSPLPGVVNPALSSIYATSSSTTNYAKSERLVPDRTSSSSSKDSHNHHHMHHIARKRKINSDPADHPLDLSTKKAHAASSVESSALLRKETLLSSSSSSVTSPKKSTGISHRPPPFPVNPNIGTQRRKDEKRRITEYSASSSHLPSTTTTTPQSKRKRGCPCVEIHPVSKWTVDEVSTFLFSIDGCADYVKRFRDNEVDGRVLTMLSFGRLTQDLGMKHEPAIHLRRTLVKLEHALRRQCRLCRDKDGCSTGGVTSFRDISSNKAAESVM